MGKGRRGVRATRGRHADATTTIAGKHTQQISPFEALAWQSCSDTRWYGCGCMRAKCATQRAYTIREVVHDKRHQRDGGLLGCISKDSLRGSCICAADLRLQAEVVQARSSVGTTLNWLRSTQVPSTHQRCFSSQTFESSQYADATSSICFRVEQTAGVPQVAIDELSSARYDGLT